MLTKNSYGVTRVWMQQWDYLMYDAAAMQTAMRTFLRSAKGKEIDMDIVKARCVLFTGVLEITLTA